MWDILQNSWPGPFKKSLSWGVGWGECPKLKETKEIHSFA